MLILLASRSLSAAAYEDLGMVRPMGMGEAFEAVSAGIDSIRYNPAGAAYIKGLQIYSSFGMPAMGFDDDTSMNSLDFGISVPFSTKPYLIFLNYIVKGLTLGNDRKVMRDGSFSFLFHQFSVAEFAYERLFTINLAKSLNNLFEGANLALGANLNIFNRGFTHTEDTLLHPDTGLKDSATSLGLDLGLTYDFSRFIRVAFVMANLIEPNISFFSDGTEVVNRQMKVGLGWNMGKLLFMQDFLLGLDLVQIGRDSGDIRKAETVYKAGLEFWQWNRQLGFRFGYKSLLDVLTAGFSFRYRFKHGHSLMVNYAFNYPLASENMKHYFSLNYEFEFPDFYFDYTTDADIEAENREIQENYRKGVVVVKYKTLPNDNLYNIALVHYGSPDKADVIKKYNKIEDEKDLPVMIDVPYDAKTFELYKVQPTDSLETISLKFYSTERETGKIRRFNKIEFSRVKPGRVLVIPITAAEKEQFRIKGDAMENLKKANEARNREYQRLLDALASRTKTVLDPLPAEFKKSEKARADLDDDMADLEKKMAKEKDEAKRAALGETLMNLSDKRTKNVMEINTKIRQASGELEKIKTETVRDKEKADRAWKDVRDRDLGKTGGDFKETSAPDLDAGLGNIKMPFGEVSLKEKKEPPKEKPKEQPKEKPKEQPKDKAKEQPKEQPKEKPKEQPKDKAKEQPKEQPKTGTATTQPKTK